MTHQPDGYPTQNTYWWCPDCDRITPTNYRCQNWDCGADLTDKNLEKL